jgi:ribosome recycling factor
MNEEVEIYLEDAKDRMESALNHLKKELSTVRAGKANPQMLDNLLVDYYGTPTALPKISNISSPDSRSLAIQPWEKKMLEVIEKAILKANLGFTPMNNGEIIRINIPPLTEERRKSLVKQVRNEGEEAKVSIRTTRRETNDELKKLQKQGIPEDLVKDAEDKIQKMTDSYAHKIEEVLKVKEAEIMTV